MNAFVFIAVDIADKRHSHPNPGWLKQPLPFHPAAIKQARLVPAHNPPLTSVFPAFLVSLINLLWLAPCRQWCRVSSGYHWVSCSDVLELGWAQPFLASQFPRRALGVGKCASVLHIRWMLSEPLSYGDMQCWPRMSVVHMFFSLFSLRSWWQCPWWQRPAHRFATTFTDRELLLHLAPLHVFFLYSCNFGS